jgi:cell division protein FtsB
MKTKLTGTGKFLIFLSILILGLLFITFNENGLLRYLRLQTQINELQSDITNLQNENHLLQAEIDSLKNKIPAKIEKDAREKFGLIRPSEMVIEIKEKNDR